MTARCDLTTLLATAKSALVAGHINPDGDSVGSALALYHFFTGKGIATTVYGTDPCPYNFLFLPGSGVLTDRLPDGDPDLYVVVDAAAYERTGPALAARLRATKKPKIVFDHHVAYDDPSLLFDQVFLDDTAAATAQVIYRFLRDGGHAVSREIATAIYAAIMSDTGGMRYRSTNRAALETLAAIVDQVDPWDVAAQIWEEMPLAQVRLLAEVLGSIRLLADGRAAVFEIRREQLDRYGLGPDHVDQFINYARAIKGVEVAMRFRELAPGRYKVSMRSKGSIDASLISRELGGGGHRNAAGFLFTGSLDEGCTLLEEIVARVAR